ncbi:hypothetical protein [Thiomicrorhabdus sp.]|uniref:hypothetical protein n=1 Tax=Thiomicrorhabdus sp. TaxID=2039724 RepID=UPI003565F576
MAQSPELAGGEGFTFEGDIAAFYLSALLSESYAPGTESKTVTCVSVQQRDFGEPLDDIIVDSETIDGNKSRLSLQAKRSLTISSSKTNKDFRDIIRDSWNTFSKIDFRINIDRCGAAVGTISDSKKRALQTLCEWARESTSFEHFEQRFSSSGSASSTITSVKNEIELLLNEVKSSQVSSEELHQFLSHFVLIQFDFIHEGSTHKSQALNLIRDCLIPSESHKAPLVWSRLVQQARLSAGKSGVIDRPKLVRVISEISQLKGGTSYIADLEILKELAKSSMDLISDDIGGFTFERTELYEKLGRLLSKARLVQVRGLPGSGKSVLVKQRAKKALEDGTVLFIKGEQLDGFNWITYARTIGLSNLPLEHLLVEIGATGTPILFIDAIDRIKRVHQPIILDLIRTISESKLLDNWRIVASLRDTGVEVLRNWLGSFLDHLQFETLTVGQLTDNEADELANAQPNLRPILFGNSKVSEIVRRPFFAKVLCQGFTVNSAVKGTEYTPGSERELIEHWWVHGGFNEGGQNALERQRVLLELASQNARSFGEPIRNSHLSSINQLSNLISDGIVQPARKGVSVRFSHDIFFEWSFFYVLTDKGSKWIDEIKACGEAPALARTVELLSQWEYFEGESWQVYLKVLKEDISLRTQWLRSWLLGPLGTTEFTSHIKLFSKLAFQNDYELFVKVLVWFQAEKTVPNLNLSSNSVFEINSQHYSYLLAWPSDFASWSRLINFTLSNIDNLPSNLFPEILSIFEVWQNALAGISNPVSESILTQCDSWLLSTNSINYFSESDPDTTFWKGISDLTSFKSSLVRLILMSSRAHPDITSAFLNRVISKKVREDEFNEIVGFSPILSQTHPRLLVDLTLLSFKMELPHDRVKRQKEEEKKDLERIEKILAKPEEERTRKEQQALSFRSGLGIISNFSMQDWDSLAIHDHLENFFPPSPLREPFNSLFKSAPDEAIRLLCELCNHAISAWRQLHEYSHEGNGTPIPLEINFPWGTQRFWGSNREYLWCRGYFGPNIIESGFLALEEWCFKELDKTTDINKLLKKILEDNESIAILGTAAMIAIQSDATSESLAPLFTSQRLLSADENRWHQEISSSMKSNLMGFKPHEKEHFIAVDALNNKTVRKKPLSSLITRAIFSGDKALSDRVKNNVLQFKNKLPFEYEEDINQPEIESELLEEAKKFEELVVIENYHAYKPEENSDLLEIVHVSPSASSPESIVKRKQNISWLQQSNLWAWAARYFEEGVLSESFTLNDAIRIAKEADTANIFSRTVNVDEELIDVRRGAVAATAALVLIHRNNTSLESLEWARDVLIRAELFPETFGAYWSPKSDISWHPSIYVAHGLVSEIREGTEQNDTVERLLRLVSHPLEIVSISALSQICMLWESNPKLTWCGIRLALRLCHYNSCESKHFGSPYHSSEETQSILNEAIQQYTGDKVWLNLPLPPPAWVKVNLNAEPPIYPAYEYFDDEDLNNVSEVWGEPLSHWRSKYAAKIFQLMPVKQILNSEANELFLDFLQKHLDWTIEKNAPSWAKTVRRRNKSTLHYEWTLTLSSSLGFVSGLTSFQDFKNRFLDPILKLDEDICWVLLSPLIETAICNYIYDAEKIHPETILHIQHSLDRLLESKSFRRGSYRAGKLSGFKLPQLVRSMMFVSVERADLSRRFVNGNWSEILVILPIVDKFIRSAGWATSVISPFLTLCERSKEHYPVAEFADQILSILTKDANFIHEWNRELVPSRIAELVHYFAYRDGQLESSLAKKYLMILDFLIDMGDRRSSALQQDQMFKEIRLN